MSDTVLIEIRGVYDGWSIKALPDGTYVNRWANEDGTPAKGYERRFEATQRFIDELEEEEAQE